MKEPLQVTDIAGISLAMASELVQGYIEHGFADPAMYRFTMTMAELADEFRERARVEEAPEEVVKAIGELSDSIKLTAMQAGEIVQKMIEENGWHEQVDGWDRLECDDPTCEHNDE
jgi:hypothetical protein